MTKIGVGQSELWVGDPQSNRRAIQSLLAETDQAGAEILVLPELANSGYAFQDQDEAKASAETIPGGPVSELLTEWSRGGRLVVGGFCEQAGDALYNSAAVFADGAWRATYRKAHLFMKETAIFTAGSEPPPVIAYHGYRIGVMICFDWIFPEMARVLALNGAQILLHPANLVLPYCQQVMIARSIENRVFTATANRWGAERELYFSGKSQITSPKGELLAQGGADFTGVITAEVDLTLADDKRITPYNHLFDDRRPELYQRLIEMQASPAP
jgi:beta-ureidopropionase